MLPTRVQGEQKNVAIPDNDLLFFEQQKRWGEMYKGPEANSLKENIHSDE